jgi:hypothetical protein
MSHTRPLPRIPLRSPTPTPEEGLVQPARWSYQANNMRLDSLDDYRLEMNRLYRLARGNQLRLQDLTRLIYALRQASDLAREQQELTELRALNEQLQQLRPNTPYLTGNTMTSLEVGSATEGELLPPAKEDE